MVRSPSLKACRHTALIVAGIVAALVLALSLLLSFGWGLMRPVLERRLSAELHRPLTIVSVRRLDAMSLHPVLAVEGVRIAQPDWAGPGDIAQARRATVRVALLPLLIGRVQAELQRVDGLRLTLVRARDGRVNWRGGAGKGSPFRIGTVVAPDVLLSLDDREGDVFLAARVTIDARGFRLAGTGRVGASPAMVRVTGPPVADRAPWPFHAELRSKPLSIALTGTMRVPLDLDHITARATSSGGSLTDLDRPIGAGLPATQPYRFAGIIRHDAPDWYFTDLSGTLGRSAVAGNLAVRKPGGRTRIDASLVSTGFDFDDLASNAALARGAAEARRAGPRLFPDVPIHLDHLRHTDGVLHFDLRRLLFTPPAALRSLTGVLTLDHGVLTVDPLVAGLTRGRVTGSAVVRHRSGLPLLTLDLTLADGRLEALATDPAVANGPLVGRVRLSGLGMTIRAAVGRSSGSIGLVSRGGAIGRRIALFLGADVGRGIFAGKKAMIPLTCVAARLIARDGIARPMPLVIDTPVARADGRGSLDLADERLALLLDGAPKRASLLRLDGPIRVTGTLRAPRFDPPPLTRTARGVFGMIGKAIGGDARRLAGDADCSALAARALR